MRDDLTKKKVFMLCGHAQSGKTSLAEGILFKSGAIPRLGRVEEANTVSDYEDDEKNRASSINLAVVNAQYKENFLQIIDAPGYLDFVGETILASRGADFAVMVVDAAAGVEVGTDKTWDIIRQENLPCMFFVNKLDKEDTNFQGVVADIQKSFSKKAIPFCSFEDGKIINNLKDKSSSFYGQIVEAVAESDDALLEKYLESGAIDDQEFEPALKKAIANGNLFPIVCGFVTSDSGIDSFLDIMISAMPSAADALARKVNKKGEEIEIAPKVDGPLVAQVFKTIIDPFVGQLSIFRVFSGKISSSSDIFNGTQASKEKLGQIFLLQGKQQVTTDAICAGEIGAVAKLKNTSTMDVFCDASGVVEFASLNFPSPAYSASVKPKTRKDEEKISTALSRLTSEDSTIMVSRDSGELIISGMGELHLNVIIERMKRKYGADVELGTPKVPYKETITKSVKVQGKHKKQTGGHGQYGDCSIDVQPLDPEKDLEFVNSIVGGAIPKNFIPSVEKGVRKAMKQGMLAGCPVFGVKVTLYDGSYHPVDSSDMAFQMAGSLAMRKALEQAGSVLLEPIMDVEIVIPGELMGQITGDINGRRGKVMGMEVKGKNEAVKAQIPLAEMFKYASDLRSVTGGRGSYSMSFSHCAQVPARIAQGIIDKAKKEKEEEVHSH
ncbi:MAG: elongation factor G [Candidatus Omnitrophica bacterium]|nr:elongation factor G [Candidatus Omnitrophota bacterium]